MKLETSIVQSFLQNDNEYYIKSHWIYSIISEDEILFEKVSQDKNSIIKSALDIFKGILKDFEPLNSDIWTQLYGKFDWDKLDVVIYLTVGIPYPYDALVRNDNYGNPIIILDLNRIVEYGNEPERIADVISTFLTHEMSHIMNKKYLKILNDSENLEVLKYIFIDEGIAHRIAYNSKVLGQEIEEAIKGKKFDFSSEQMEYYIKNPNLVNQDVIIRSCTGKFWEKFAGIDGMRCVHDKLKNSIDYKLVSGKSIDALFEEIYNKQK